MRGGTILITESLLSFFSFSISFLLLMGGIRRPPIGPDAFSVGGLASALSKFIVFMEDFFEVSGSFRVGIRREGPAGLSVSGSFGG